MITLIAWIPGEAYYRNAQGSCYYINPDKNVYMMVRGSEATKAIQDGYTASTETFTDMAAFADYLKEVVCKTEPAPTELTRVNT